ncbi:hypothetical protein [Oryzomonas rubra]|uniref:Lipoprotein n=1 Tax=Oryzomonas rubra TaxID=2509454 RepID=A0A5A9XEI0_9BACT|nr:hypothetical protein [Oryzomonas rubra]KAA0891320.1 hypothetical protein ET418_11085 [Oryzomonas rubra]
MNVCRNSLAIGCSLALAMLLQAGCATQQKAAVPTAQPTGSAEQAAPQILTGKVFETMNSGGYTYIGLDSDGKKTWVAVPPMKVEVGQEVKLRPGMQMGKFTSNTLKRTFDNIIFSSGPVMDAAQPMEGLPKVDPNAKLPEGHPQIGQNAQLPHDHPSTSQKYLLEKGSAPNTGEKTAMTPEQQAKVDAIAQSMPAGHKSMAGGTEMSGTISGTVVETMDGGGYTYVNIENAGKKTWVAFPVTTVTVGQNMELASGMEMKNFTSKSLNRTFDSVIFSAGPVAK